jgi:hypothetical protein
VGASVEAATYLDFALFAFQDPGTAVEERSSTPQGFSLAQNYPNPFNPATTIRYAIAAPCQVRLVVHDLLGRKVAVLVNEPMVPGSYEARFDAAGLAGGVYFYSLTAGTNVVSRKMTLVR